MLDAAAVAVAARATSVLRDLGHGGGRTGPAAISELPVRAEGTAKDCRSSRPVPLPGKGPAGKGPASAALISSVLARGLVHLGAGISHPRFLCCQGFFAPASIPLMPATERVGQAWSLRQPQAAGDEAFSIAQRRDVPAD